MPELPEVETTVRGLKKLVVGQKITDVWTDWPKYFSVYGGPALGWRRGDERDFKKTVVGKKITGLRRRGKNVLFELSGNYLMLVHQKMSGHLLVGSWRAATAEKPAPMGWESQLWVPDPFEGHFADPLNKHIRLILFLNGREMLVLSDARRFAKVLVGPEEELLKTVDLSALGPEALDLSVADFVKLFAQKRGRIKQVLMDQKFIAGIGNIYADEILYKAKIHPLSRVEKLKSTQLKVLYAATRDILKKAVRAKGTSIDDYREPSGKKGEYGKQLLVYQKKSRECPNGHIIERIVIAGRSAHFCPKEQKIYN